ncbi:alcohol dehydrogenase protein [Rutstroemia sp. NJR-2017a BVV2]|nr:alcohol dehydrogenase protein [Rutstroemia sp. NJR-2017a BVV2]
MALPTSTRAWRRTEDGKSLELVTDSLPQSLQPNEVLVKIHAVSLNFRDVAMLHDRYLVSVIDRGVPCSDAAATVLAVGSAVKEFKPDDYVSTTWVADYELGERSGAMGGDIDGTLREYAVFTEDYLTLAPAHLSVEEVSTISCAGNTAWTSLDLQKKFKVKTALLEGTGGVSMFSLMICLGAGITPIITSSSDEKLDRIKALAPEGKVLGINYRKVPDWDEEAKRLTNGRGVDVVVNNVGEASVEKCINALRPVAGTVSLVGFLGGVLDPTKKPSFVVPLMSKSARVQGIAVGSKEDQQELCAFLSEKKVSLKPIIDKVFDFKDAVEAFDYLYSGAHTGKVVIKL